MNVDELATILGKRVQIKWSQSLSKFYVSIDGVWLKEDIALSSCAGYGTTPELAKQDYGTKLAGQKIVLGLQGKHEINIPNTMGVE